MMTQLILNGTYMPYSSNGNYYCHEEPLYKQLTMISGRVVTEMRGKVWTAHYEYDHLPDDIWRAISPALIAKTPVPCAMISDTSDEMVTATMICTDMSYPKFAFDSGGKAMWHDIAFTLREERPRHA